MTDGKLLIVGAVILIAMLAFERVGDLLGRKFQAPDDSPRFVYILTSIFSLLALLIGFTFSITLSRHDARLADIVDEANAIGTAHFRAGMLEPQMGKPLQESLAAYVSFRIAYGKAGLLERGRLAGEANRLRGKIEDAGRLVRPIAATPLGVSVIASVNDVVDSGVKRDTNMNARLPWTVFAMLVSISCAAACGLGLAYPHASRHRKWANLFLFVMLTMTILTILDLDRPAKGSITIDQSAMEYLHDSIN